MTPKQYEAHLEERFQVAMAFARDERPTSERLGAAAALGISLRTLSNDIGRARKTPAYPSWRPKPRGPKPGQHRTKTAVTKVVGRKVYADASKPNNKNKQSRDLVSECINDGVPQEDIPSQKTLRRRAEEVEKKDPVLFAAKRHGRKGKKDFRLQEGSLRCEQPLQTVQIDHTKLNHRSLILDGQPYSVRPWLTAAIDLCTSTCLAAFISPLRPSELTVSLCIAMIGTPKTGLLRAFGIPGAWDECGIASVIHVDGGPEFGARGVQDGYDEHGTHLRVEWPGYPERRGKMERWFRTINSEVHTWSGTTMCNPQELEDHGGQTDASMDFFDTQRRLLIAVMEYNHETYGGTRPTPASLWQEATADPSFRIRIPPDPLKYWIDHLPGEGRDLRFAGIKFLDSRYSSPELLKWTYDRKLDLEIKYDPRNITFVWARPRKDHAWEKVPRVDPVDGPTTYWDMVEYNRRRKRKAEDSRDVQLLAELHAAKAGKIFGAPGSSGADFLDAMETLLAQRAAADGKAAAAPTALPAPKSITAAEPEVLLAEEVLEEELSATSLSFSVPDYKPRMR